MIILYFLTVPLCFASQVYIWVAWRGMWRLFGSLPFLALLAGLIHGYASKSNLWPFWILEFAPHALGLAVVLLIVRFIVRRLSRDTP
jgi:hypothetical protein